MRPVGVVFVCGNDRGAGHIRPDYMVETRALSDALLVFLLYVLCGDCPRQRSVSS